MHSRFSHYVVTLDVDGDVSTAYCYSLHQENGATAGSSRREKLPTGTIIDCSTDKRNTNGDAYSVDLIA